MPVSSRVAFTVGSLPVYWYGILIAISIGSGIALAMAREGRMRLPKDTTLNLSLWVVPFSLIGARLYYVAFTWEQYRDDLLLIFDTRSGGMAIYGAVIGGMITGLIYARLKRLSFARLCDLVAPALALGQAIGRWGNFVNQEAFGYAVDNSALQWFPMSVFIESDGLWHLATFFYESSWCLLICAFLLIGERRALFRRPGDGFLWYALLYAAERALVEGLRTDSLMWGPVRVSQALSLLVALICAAALIIRTHKTKWRRTP